MADNSDKKGNSQPCVEDRSIDHDVNIDCYPIDSTRDDQRDRDVDSLLSVNDAHVYRTPMFPSLTYPTYDNSDVSLLNLPQPYTALTEDQTELYTPMVIERGSLDISDPPQNSPSSQIRIVVQSPSGSIRPATYEFATLGFAQDARSAELALATGHDADPEQGLTRYGRLRLWIHRRRVPVKKLIYAQLVLLLAAIPTAAYAWSQQRKHD